MPENASQKPVCTCTKLTRNGNITTRCNGDVILMGRYKYPLTVAVEVMTEDDFDVVDKTFYVSAEYGQCMDCGQWYHEDAEWGGWAGAFPIDRRPGGTTL